MTSATCRLTSLIRRLDATLAQPGGSRALSRTLSQLVRHREPGAAAPALRLDGRQRQPRRLADRTRAGAPRDRRAPADARATARRTRRHGRRAGGSILVERRPIRTDGRSSPRSIVSLAPSISATHSPAAEDVVTAIQALGAQLATAAATAPSSGAVRMPRTEIAYWCRAVLEDVERLPAEPSVSTDSLRDARQSCVRTRRCHAVRLPVRPAAAHLLHRIPPGRR